VAAPPVGKEKDIEKSTNKGVDDPKKQIEHTERELAQLQVSFLIDGVRDNKHSGELYAKVQGLKDASAKSMIVGARNGYGKPSGPSAPQPDQCIQISPISNMEAAAAKIDFGLVVAVDPVDRVILVDASAKPAPRPEKGWPGAKAIDQYVTRKIALFFDAKSFASEPLKQFGRDKLVIVCVSKEFQSAGVLDKLKSLAEVTATEYRDIEVDLCPRDDARVTLYTIAPIAKMSDVSKVLAGTENVGVDEELRFVLIGLDSAKPRKAKVKQPAPPK
jgi:hypothetical protein